MTDKIQAPVFHGKSENGRLVLDRREDFASLIQKLDGQEIDITLRKRRRVRSLSANGYYWGVLVPILSEHTGYDPEEMHGALKQRFLTDHTDERLPRVRSTSSLDTNEFAVYIDACIRLAAEMGVIIPEPQ